MDPETATQRLKRIRDDWNDGLARQPDFDADRFCAENFCAVLEIADQLAGLLEKPPVKRIWEANDGSADHNNPEGRQ